jgi:hypothetical protein
MFGSTILDVAIAVILLFLAVSLAASAITEAISSVLKLREGTLVSGVKALLNDPDFTGIALDLYKHALVNPLASDAATSLETLTHTPAYIDSRQFASAFMGILNKNGDAPAQWIATIPDAQLKAAMQALWADASGDVASFKTAVATWFDTSMDRVSGWYKRKTQWISFLVALAIAALLNVNALYAGAQVWTRPGVLADIASPQASNAAGAMTIFNQFAPAYLIGWASGPAPHDVGSWFIAVVSWVVVSAATLFGAAFWFDILNQLIQVRGTGLVPKKADDTQPN